MRKHALKLTSLIALAMAVTFLGPQRAAADDDDPPTRVARLSEADGSVSFEPAGTEDWVTAVVNRPLTTGDKLWADHDSRAELHLGSASIRLGANTGFSFLNLDDRTAQLQLTEGTLRIRIRRLSRDEIFEVDTPNLAFNASRPGIYRINVNAAGDTTVVVVRDGEGEVTGGGQSYVVRADETGIFTGTDQLSADIEGVGDDDDLERWSYERDRREDHSASRQYVSDEAIGYEDLDEYGGWRNTPDYGTIWFPHTTVVGWAPYRYGHWVWIAPWGYTWVDDEPWGFAPFHYGRWVVVGGSWGWVPCRPGPVGVAYVRPVYAPALVAWVGGPNIAIGVAVGGGAAVGWFPLGPREVYVPSYHVSRTYVNNVNVTNTTVNTTVVNNYYNNVVVNKTNVTNVTYVNQRVPGAVTATSTQAFTTAQPVARNVVRVDERQLANAQVTARTPALPPERQAFAGGGRPTQARPPQQVVTRAVVAKTAPPPPPAPVERQQALIRQNGGQAPPVSQIRQAQPEQQARAAAPVRMAPPARQVTTPQRDAGNRPAPPQNSNRPMQQPSNVQQNSAQQNNGQQNNRPANPPANADRPNNAQPNRPPDRPNNAQQPSNSQQPNNAQPNRPPDRPNNSRPDRPPSAQPANPNERPNTPPSAQPNRAPDNQQPNRPANAERPNTPPPSAQPNRPPDNQPPNNQPPNGRNDRPPSARPSNPPPNGNPQLEQQHQQELQNMRKQQDQERQRVEQQQAQERQRADQQRADDQRRQQLQQQHEQQLQDLERKHNQQEQQVQQRQQQEHQQQRPSQPPPQQRPPQAERQQPPPRQQQQPPPRQQDKPKEKEKPPKS